MAHTPLEGHMAEAKRGIGTHREGRQQRQEQPEVPGATGRDPERVPSPEKAQDAALHRLGKTEKHTSADR
jgi:hypothetical protein